VCVWRSYTGLFLHFSGFIITCFVSHHYKDGYCKCQPL